MKKIILTVSCLSMVLMGTVSCNNDEYDVASQEATISQEDALALQGLQNDIASLNDATFGEQQVKSRGFGGFFRRFMKIVASDAIGGLFGSLAGGPVGTIAGAAAASGAAAIPTVNSKIVLCRATVQTKLDLLNDEKLALDDVVLPGNTNSVRPAQLTLEDSVGYYHNKALLEIDRNSQNGLAGLSTSELTNRIYLSVERSAGLKTGTLQSEVNKKTPELIKLNENIQEYINKSETEEAYLLQMKKLYPKRAAEIAVIEEFVKGVKNLNPSMDDSSYAKAVLNLIEKSKLSEEMKKNLRTGVIVGNASARLWNPEAFE